MCMNNTDLFDKIFNEALEMDSGNKTQTRPIYDCTIHIDTPDYKNYVYHVDAPAYFQDEYFTPKKIIKNNKTTIVIWTDNTKTIVRCGANEVQDEYHAFTAALAKKIFGTNTRIKKIVSKTIVQDNNKRNKK